MRSKIAQTMYEKTPEDIKIFVRKYADIIVLISRTLKEKGWTQKHLAMQMDKAPSEISKWLSGEHNLTLKSIAKLEAELGVTLIEIPVKQRTNQFDEQYVKATYTFTVEKKINVDSVKIIQFTLAHLTQDTPITNVG